MKQLRLRLASSLPGTAALANIELDGNVIHASYSTSADIHSASVLTMDVADTGIHELKVKFLNDNNIDGNDLNLIIGRCQLSNDAGTYVLGEYLAVTEEDNYSNGFVKELFYQDEIFSLTFDSANPLLFLDYTSGGDGTKLETNTLSVSDASIENPENAEFTYVIGREASNTPLSWSMSPEPPAWVEINEYGEISGTMPAGVDLTFDVTAIDFGGISATCKLTIKTLEPE